jgi:hypothetical protein
MAKSLSQSIKNAGITRPSTRRRNWAQVRDPEKDAFDRPADKASVNHLPRFPSLIAGVYPAIKLKLISL